MIAGMDSAASTAYTVGMKRFLPFAFTAILAGCGTHEIAEGPKPPPAAKEWTTADPDKLKYEAREIPGGLEILDEGEVISRIRSVHPVIERWAFVKNGDQIIIRSSGLEGPAKIQLFDCRSAICRATVTPDQVVDGRPAWAAGFAAPKQ
jgi:hypothetical protein